MNTKKDIFNAAVALMDDEIRESVNADVAPCSERDFLAEYCARHIKKYGDAFLLDNNLPALEAYDAAPRPLYFWLFRYDKAGDCDEARIYANNEAIATEAARTAWDHLSAYDQSRVEKFELLLAPEDDDGNLDLDHARLLLRIK